MSRAIRLIRHGQASAGTHDYDRLSPLGQQQARLLGEPLRALSDSTVQVWSGSLRRQRQTASIALEAAGMFSDVRQHHGLNEYDHIQVHDRYHPQAALHRHSESASAPVELPTDMSFEIYSQIIQAWRNEKNSLHPMETWPQFRRRVRQAVLEAAQTQPQANLHLFTSGGVIATVVCELQGLPLEALPRLIWDLHNASITTLRLHRGKMSVDTFNDISHLERHLDPALITLI